MLVNHLSISYEPPKKYTKYPNYTKKIIILIVKSNIFFTHEINIKLVV